MYDNQHSESDTNREKQCFDLCTFCRIASTSSSLYTWLTIHREEGTRINVCNSLFTSFISVDAFSDLALTVYLNGFG